MGKSRYTSYTKIGIDVYASFREPHDKQKEIFRSNAKRKVVRAGRRSGKTTIAAYIAAYQFLNGKRILYAVPTQEQIDRFWYEVKRTLEQPLSAGVFYKNETRHIIEKTGSEARIRAKTAWDPDTLRGDYADLLILDEYQQMDESAWTLVGAPMLLDNNGDAIFIYTPPSIQSIVYSRAKNPRHAADLFKRAQKDTTGRWAAFHFTSMDNKYLNREALAEVQQDMTDIAYRQEILAEDIEDNPGALWRREWIDHVTDLPDLSRLVVAVDPAATAAGDEWGIVAVGTSTVGDKQHLYVLEDASTRASPDEAARVAIALYNKLQADRIVAEANQGGEMVTLTFRTVDPTVPVKLVYASRGKHVRAEPISAIYQQGRAHHVGSFYRLEDELCQWQPGSYSPNRLDALVWGATFLLGRSSGGRGT